MVTSLYGEPGSPCNALPPVFSAAFAPALPERPTPRRTPPAPQPLVTAFERDLLLDAVAETGSAELGHLVGLLPNHPRPLSAVVALIDAGDLILDVAAPFDASIRLWHGRPQAC
ncbi:hypothetical protein [Methylobacterium nigriterrae]|uniref:hypothetical protein n=1 Tax=Methylobacterium nigriterrae TaxID=3127512 RepID=UPI003013DFCA